MKITIVAFLHCQQSVPIKWKSLHGHVPMTRPVPTARHRAHTGMCRGRVQQCAIWPMSGQQVRTTTEWLSHSPCTHVPKWVASPPAKGEKEVRGYPATHTISTPRFLSPMISVL
jgi:hypothetical protein